MTLLLQKLSTQKQKLNKIIIEEETTIHLKEKYIKQEKKDNSNFFLF